MAVTKFGTGQGHVTATYEHELLAGSLTRKQMLPYRATIRARSMLIRGTAASVASRSFWIRSFI